jgi:hypothetical protein
MSRLVTMAKRIEGTAFALAVVAGEAAASC